MDICWKNRLFIVYYLRPDLVAALARLQVHDLTHDDFKAKEKRREETIKSQRLLFKPLW